LCNGPASKHQSSQKGGGIKVHVIVRLRRGEPRESRPTYAWGTVFNHTFTKPKRGNSGGQPAKNKGADSNTKSVICPSGKFLRDNLEGREDVGDGLFSDLLVRGEETYEEVREHRKRWGTCLGFKLRRKKKKLRKRSAQLEFVGQIGTSSEVWVRA